MKSKKEQRIKYKKVRNELPFQMVQEFSEKICRNLQSSFLYQAANQVCFYYPLEREADLLPLAKEALEQGKQVAFPKVNGDTMEFYQVHSLNEFAEGCFHVMEPLATEPVSWETALVLAPGLVFDWQGNRIGYGKAYYDKYFTRHEALVRVGIAYTCQLTSEVRSEPQDKQMQYLCTEEKLTKILSK